MINNKYFSVKSSGAAASGIAYKRPNITGQMFSYVTGDDGWHLAAGTYNYTPPANPESVATLDNSATNPNITLLDNNVFGNTNRYTDDAGAQTYSNNYVIDHLTGLGWYRVQQSAATFNNQIAAAIAYTTLYSDWRVPSRTEIASLINYDSSVGLNYSPFNISAAVLYTSTSRLDSGASAANGYFFQTNTGISSSNAKTTSRTALFCRNHYT